MANEKGGKTRDEVIYESMREPKKIDTTIDFQIPRATTHKGENFTYHCTCCGKGYNARKTNFQKTSSVLFQANEGYLPWCKACTDKFFNLLVAFYSGNEEHAIEHFCHTADWVYDIEPLKAAREISSDRSRISHYAAKKNLNVGVRKTYIDSLRYAYENKLDDIIESKEQVKNADSSVTASAIDRWGVGFTEMDYRNLDTHYKMLKKNNPNADNNQEIFIKDLCHLNMLKTRALQQGDSKEFANLTEQYAKTFKQAGLKAIEERDSSNDNTFGVTLDLMSKYTPEEFYLDKKKFMDEDKTGDYGGRFILRPLVNLLTGSNIRDKEYFVPEGDDNE